MIDSAKAFLAFAFARIVAREWRFIFRWKLSPKESREPKLYALVTVLHPPPSRRPRRRGGRLAPSASARGLHTTARLGNLFVPALGLARRAARDEGHTRGDGRDRRAGVLPARAPPGRRLEGVWTLAGDGRQHVPPQRPEGRGHGPRHDARGGLHFNRAARDTLLQATAADVVPDTDQVPRRGAAEVWADATAPVHNEGRIHV